MVTALDKYADAEPHWDGPVVIESHISGVRTKEMNPNTPVGYDEIAEDAIRCGEAGTGAIHAHATSFDLLDGGGGRHPSGAAVGGIACHRAEGIAAPSTHKLT